MGWEPLRTSKQIVGGLKTSLQMKSLLLALFLT